MSTHQSEDGGIDDNTVNGRVAGHNVIAGGISAVNGGHNVVYHGDYHFYASSAPNEVRKLVEPFAQLYFPRNEDFVERPDITEWLEKTLRNPGSRAALWGLGGVGKSQLAIRYAQDLEHRSPETFIFWIYARTRDLFITGYREIAEKLGLLPDPSEADDTVLRAVRDWCHQNKQWLMILDNADDVTIFKNTTTSGGSASEDGSVIRIQSLSNFLPRGRTGSLFITSRDKAAAHFLAGHRNARMIPVMMEHEAIQLLRKKLGDYNDEDCEVALVQALDCVPLAITQAASYIAFEADTGLTTPAKYLELFRLSDQERVSLLSKVTVDDPFREPGTSPAIVTTWKITFSRIKETNDNAAWLLSLMSFLHNQGIPQWFLENIYAHCPSVTNVGQALANDLGVLCRYALITRFRTGNGGREELHDGTAQSRQYYMHGTIRTCTRAWLEESGENDEYQLLTLKCLGLFHPDPCFESWTRCGELSPHVDSLLNLLPRPGLFDLDENDAPFLLRMLSCAGNYSIDTGRLARASVLLTEAFDLAEVTYCPGHKCIFRAVTDLWKLHKSFSEHHPLQVQIPFATNGLYNSLRRILINPSYNIAALQSYGISIETILQDPRTSEHKEALSLFHELRTLGPDILKDSGCHIGRFIDNAPPCSFTSSILELLVQFVNTLGFVGRNAEGETIYRAMLRRRIQFPAEDWLREVGFSDDDIRFAIYDSMLCQGKHEELLDLLEPNRATLEIPDAKHLSLCNAHEALGVSLMKQGKWEDAEKVWRELLDGSNRRIGSRDPISYKVRMHIVECLTEQGNHTKAVEDLGNIVEMCKKLLGFEHPNTLEATVMLGQSLNTLGRYVQTEALLRGCLATLQSNHEDRIESSTYCLAITTLFASLKAQGKNESQISEFVAQIVDVAPDYHRWASKHRTSACNRRESQSPTEQSVTEDTVRTLAAALPNTTSGGATISDLVHNYLYKYSDMGCQDNLQDWVENTAARAVEQLHVGERMVGRNDTSRPEMKRLFAIGLGERRSLHAERALEDCMRMLREVKKGAGEVLDKDRSDVRGDEDEMEEDVE